MMRCLSSGRISGLNSMSETGLPGTRFARANVMMVIPIMSGTIWSKRRTRYRPIKVSFQSSNSLRRSIWLLRREFTRLFGAKGSGESWQFAAEARSRSLDRLRRRGLAAHPPLIGVEGHVHGVGEEVVDAFVHHRERLREVQNRAGQIVQHQILHL